MLLTDEENPYNNPAGREREEDGMFSKYEIFERGAKAQLKKVVEWLEEDCPHDVTPQMPYRRAKRKHCVECWQALLEEVK